MEKAYDEAEIIQRKAKILAADERPGSHDYEQANKSVDKENELVYEDQKTVIDAGRQEREDAEKIEAIRAKLASNEIKSELPKKLYRAFTINPSKLSVEKLKETLIPLNANGSDPTKISDGNELGVYMSTNEQMVEKAYASGCGTNIAIKCPKFHDGYTLVDHIKLPSCGIILEIDTKNLDIRKPEITPYLQGIYNNGFQGDEWIADAIPANHYKVKKFILSRFANDSERFETEVADNNIEEAMDLIKTEFQKRKEAALKYKEFLESIPEQARINGYGLKRKWQKYLEEERSEAADYVKKNLESFENVEIKKLSALPYWNKISKFLSDKGISDGEVVIIDDEKSWESVYGSNDSKSSHKPKAIILKKEIFNQENISEENISWLIHEIGHIEFYKNLGDNLDEYMDEYHKKREYAASEMEKAAFSTQFEYLKSVGKTKTECLGFVEKYLNKSFGKDQKEARRKELEQIESYITSVFKY